MKDPITTAFVVKGAVTHPQYSAFLDEMQEGEVGAVDFLIDAADMLETVFTAFNADGFDHLVFAYEIAEPFGRTIVEQTINYGGEMDMEMVSQSAGTLLARKRKATSHEPESSVEAKRIAIDLQCHDSTGLEFHYEAQGLTEHPMFPVADWRFEVANGHTQDGYWEYVYNCVHNWEEPQ
jgi:hypothetical protein